MQSPNGEEEAAIILVLGDYDKSKCLYYEYMRSTDLLREETDRSFLQQLSIRPHFYV